MAVLLTSCASIDAKDLTTQCIVISGEGEFRYGSILQYVKGEGTVLRVAESGKGCKGKRIELRKDGVFLVIDMPV